MNFEQILQEKMNSQEAKTGTHRGYTAASSFITDPAHLAFLMGQISRAPTAPLAKFPYKTVISPRKAHTLNEIQSIAFSFIKQWSPDFSDAFTRGELKSAFRQIALKVHPDQGGTAEDFMRLREHYKILMNVSRF